MNDTEFFVYNVTFVYEHFHIAVTTFAINEDDAPASAFDQLLHETNIPSTLLDRAQEITVEKVDN